MSNTISWGDIYNSTWFGDEANKASIPCDSAPVGFCDSYNAYLQAAIDVATEVPNEAALTKLNTLFNAIESYIPNMIHLGIYAGHGVESFGTINFANPTGALAANSGATWSDALGYLGNGTNAYVDLGIAPSGVYAQNSAHLSAYVRQVSTGSADQLIGQMGGLNANIRNRSALTHRINQAGNGAVSAGANSTGYHSITRTGASAYTNYWPAGSASNTTASTAALASNFCLLRGGSGYGNGAVAASTIGGSLTALDYAALKAAFDAYFA
jgi:hypothetical protein